MDTSHIIDAAGGLQFTNLELIDLLTSIKPYSKSQEDLLEYLVQEIYKKEVEPMDSLIEYLSTLDFEDIINMPVSLLYGRYLEWCKLNGLEVASTKRLTQAITERYNLSVKVRKVNNKSVRIYKEL